MWFYRKSCRELPKFERTTLSQVTVTLPRNEQYAVDYKVQSCPTASRFQVGGVAAAQTVKAEGLITGRSGATMTVQTADSPKLVVVLTDGTQVAQVQGVFKARRKQMSMAALSYRVLRSR